MSTQFERQISFSPHSHKNGWRKRIMRTHAQANLRSSRQPPQLVRASPERHCVQNNGVLSSTSCRGTRRE